MTRQEERNRTPERNYRTLLYENYVSMRAPEWANDDAQTSRVWCVAASSRLKGWLPPDKNAKCLDLGCASGRFLRALCDAGYADVHGVDLCPQAVEIARNAGFDVMQADLREYLLGSSDYFDLITAFDVIEHFGKDEVLEVLWLISKRLKPGGSLILQTPNALSPWANHLRYGDLTHEVMYTSECLASLLRMTGFTTINTRGVGPYLHGLRRVIRWPLWKAVCLGYAVWTLAETGSLLGGVYTRNMMLRATKDPV